MGGFFCANSLLCASIPIVRSRLCLMTGVNGVNGFGEYDEGGIDELENGIAFNSGATDDELQNYRNRVIDPFVDNDDSNFNEVSIAPLPHLDKNTTSHSWLASSYLAPNESQKEFQFFNAFLQLGGGRSIQYTATLFNVNQSTIYAIYKKNAWKVRAADYDRYMMAEKVKLSQDARQQEHIMKLEEYRRNQECIGRQLSMNAAKIAQIADTTLNALLENGSNLEVKDLPGILNTAAKLADIGKQLQSSALGVDQLLMALEEADVD